MSARVVLALAGLLSSGAGLVLMNAPPETLSWVPRRPLERYVRNPSEALAGIALAFASAAVVAWVTRRPPADVPKAPPLGAVAVNRRGRIALFGALAASCAFSLAGCLATGSYRHGYVLLFVAALGLATLALRAADRRCHRPTGIRPADVALALAVGALTVWLHSRGSAHWLFTFIGDEMPFFEMARDIARGARDWNAFDVVGGVYATHAFLDSAYQALVMKLSGRADVISWRFSLALIAGASAGLLYLTGVVLRGRYLGLAAAAVLGSSHYLMAFSHIGYNNSHAVFYNVLAASMLALAWRTGRWHHHWLAGVTLGLCLYTFLAAAAFWIVAAVVLVSEIAHRRSARHRLAVAFTAAGFAAAVTPALWVTTRARLTEVVSHNSIELAVSHHPTKAITDVHAENLVRSVLAFWSNDLITGHHLGGPLVDPVTGVLLIVGLVTAIIGLRGLVERLALAWFAGGLVLVAVSHYEPTPSTSRLLIVLPAVALLCGLAVDRLRELSGRTVEGVALCLALWFVLPRLNLHQLFVVSPGKMAPRRVVMVMKALQEHAPRRVVDAGAFDGDIPWVLAAYPWLEGRYVFVSDQQLVAGEPLPLEDDPIVFVDQASDPLADAVQAQLPPHYRKVEDRDPSGQYRASLFLPSGSAVGQ